MAASEGFTLKGETWSFFSSDAGVPSSSGRKLLYRGMFRQSGRRVEAIAASYVCGGPMLFGRDCALLSRFNQMGVGPELLAIGEYRTFVDKRVIPVVIQQNAGLSLEDVLAGKADDNGLLAELGTDERRRQNAKIVFDVEQQLMAMHECDVFHRDLRPANILVRRCGPGPSSIRATLIDFETAAQPQSGEQRLRYRPYYDSLFTEMPRLYSREAGPCKPRPLDVDMAYLAAVCLELVGVRPEEFNEDRFDRLVQRVDFLPGGPGALDFAAYDEDGSLITRSLSQAQDIDPLAEALGLQRFDDYPFLFEDVRRKARALVRHRTYLDEFDARLIESDPECTLALARDRLVHMWFEDRKQNYLADPQRYADRPYYDTYEQQPPGFIRSSEAKAEGVVSLLRRRHFIVVPASACEGEEVVEQFLPEEVEQIAADEHARFVAERIADGWICAERVAGLKQNPTLKPWGQLDEAEKTWDRRFAEGLIDDLKAVGYRLIRDN